MQVRVLFLCRKIERSDARGMSASRYRWPSELPSDLSLNQCLNGNDPCIALPEQRISRLPKRLAYEVAAMVFMCPPQGNDSAACSFRGFLELLAIPRQEAHVGSEPASPGSRNLFYESVPAGERRRSISHPGYRRWRSAQSTCEESNLGARKRRAP